MASSGDSHCVQWWEPPCENLLRQDDASGETPPARCWNYCQFHASCRNQCHFERGHEWPCRCYADVCPETRWQTYDWCEFCYRRDGPESYDDWPIVSWARDCIRCGKHFCEQCRGEHTSIRGPECYACTFQIDIYEEEPTTQALYFAEDVEAKDVYSFSSNSDLSRDQVTFEEEQDETTGLDPPCDDDIKADDSVEPFREELEDMANSMALILWGEDAEYAESAASEAAGQAILAGSSFQGQSLASSSKDVQVECGLRPCFEIANVGVGREPSVTSSSADLLEEWYGDGGVGTPPLELFERGHVTTPESEDAKISAAARQQDDEPTLVPTAAEIALANEEDHYERLAKRMCDNRRYRIRRAAAAAAAAAEFASSSGAGEGLPNLRHAEAVVATGSAQSTPCVEPSACSARAAPEPVPSLRDLSPEHFEHYLDFLSHWKWERNLPFNRDFWLEGYREALEYQTQRNANASLSLPWP